MKTRKSVPKTACYKNFKIVKPKFQFKQTVKFSCMKNELKKRGTASVIEIEMMKGKKIKLKKHKTSSKKPRFLRQTREEVGRRSHLFLLTSQPHRLPSMAL
ncbi:hypothetical protein M9H77_07238 [Catharanthus roseus]|uniref:Uncharacterized protein n=1 Tax=Catharanthus roseus TaxID=4058 RepID=A0ACC0BUR7_CATRO|nr:hypothetical protein M9H77_07238 [Catharanthus roseus]